MRALPGGLVIDAVPLEFTIQTTDDGATIRWDGQIDGARYMIGLRPARAPAPIAKAKEDLRIGVWQLMEFSRIGRKDLMQYAAADRHPPRGQRARPVG